MEKYKKQRIALTFDDGPGEHTERLLDILKSYGARATFFVIGNTLANAPATLKRASLEGHEIGNHTLTHSPLSYMTNEVRISELSETNRAIFEITGKTPTLCRPPFGDFSDEVGLAGADLGLSFIKWSVDTMDWKSLDSDAVFAVITENACDGDIVLCHDVHKTTVDAMERAVPWLTGRGFELVTVSELLSDKRAGELYHRAE